MKLSWEPVSGAISYEIDKINGNTAYKVGETSQTSYIYTDVEENRSYSFVVRAFDGDSLSAYSTDDVVTVTVPAREKQALTADSGGIIDQSVEIHDERDIVSDTVSISDSWLEYKLNAPDGNMNGSAVITATIETLNYYPVTFSVIVTTRHGGTIQTDIIIKEL